MALPKWPYQVPCDGSLHWHAGCCEMQDKGLLVATMTVRGLWQVLAPRAILPRRWTLDSSLPDFWPLQELGHGVAAFVAHLSLLAFSTKKKSPLWQISRFRLPGHKARAHTLRVASG